jgi:hypothetical protein
MTRKELVEALTANFAEDEEITFVYMDEEYGENVETEVRVADHTTTRRIGHWEYFDEAKDSWVKIENGTPVNPDILFCRKRWMPDGEVEKETKKVLRIGC